MTNKEQKAREFLEKYLPWLHPSAEMYGDILKELMELILNTE